MDRKDSLPFDVTPRTESMSRSLMANVFGWMFVAMIITAVSAFFAASSSSFLQLIYKPEGGFTIMGWVVTLAPLLLVFMMSAAINRMSSLALSLLYIVYSVLMGLSLSYIFLLFSFSNIFKAFAVAALMFGVMAVAGYVTKTDLSRFGSILMMALVGIIIATLVNFFTKSETMDYVICILGVLIFTGLTAWDVQKIKNTAVIDFANGDTMRKVAIWGALSLYLDFVNLFVFLLRIFGRNNN